MSSYTAGGGGVEPYRVMVVDDSAVIRGLFIRVLEADPEIRVVASAANGRIALNQLKRQPVEVVVLDIEMPEMDGLAATRAIRASKSHAATIPIIALTAYSLPADIQKVTAAGMTAVVTKPVSRTELLEALITHAVTPEVAAAEPALDAPPLNAPPGRTEDDLLTIDVQTLEDLLTDQDDETRNMLLDAFRRDLATQDLALADAIAQRDLAKLERASHVLKSVTGTLGAHALSRLANQVNTLARQEDPAAFAEAARFKAACAHLMNDPRLGGTHHPTTLQ